MPSGSERTFRAKTPIRIPVMSPFTVDPVTICRMYGFVSGAESSADIPSKIPRTPPSVSPSSGLFIRPPLVGWFEHEYNVRCAVFSRFVAQRLSQSRIAARMTR